MTQKSSSKKPESPPPNYSMSPQFADSLMGHTDSQEILEEQVGGGRRYVSPPVEHTPTKLRSHIKATDRDAGLVKEASVRRAMLVCDEPTRGHSSEPVDTLLTETGGQSVVDAVSPSTVPLEDIFYKLPHNPHQQPPGHLPPSFLQESAYDFSCLDYHVNAILGPSTAMVPTIPETRIIPPTPAAVKDWQVASVMPAAGVPYPDHHHDALHALMDNTADVPAVKGRRQDATNAALQEGFVDLEHVVQELSHKTSLPTHQVIALWNKSHARVINNVNHWNAYSIYFKDNYKQELSRLGPEAPEHGTPSATVRRNCYELFKKSFPDTWQDILELHKEAAMLLGTPQTVAMRGQEFQKFCKRLVGMMDAAAARFGFEAAFVACGKVVNQDGSLGHSHTTPGAAGFWLTRCKADEDTVIGHLKAQVYNLASLSVVEDAFDEDKDRIKEDHPPEHDVSVVSSDTLEIPKGTASMTYVKAECSRQVAQLGGKFLSDKNFPWKTLAAELIRLGMMIVGYPEDYYLEVVTVAGALKAGTMRVKKVSEAVKGKLVTSEAPVVVGAPPSADSVHMAGRRLFANGTIDRQGPPREKPSVAATRRKVDASKTWKAPLSRASPLSLSDDDSDNNDSSETNIPPVKATSGPAIARKVVRVIVPPPSREFKFVKKNGKKQEVICLVSSDPPSASEDPMSMAKGDSDYEDHVTSRKRKAKSEATLRASKKIIPSPSEANTAQPKTGSVQGNKGKAPVRSFPQTVQSSDDESVHEPTKQAPGSLQAAKRLRDGPPQVENEPLVKERPRPRPVTKLPAPANAKPLVEYGDSDSTNGTSHTKTAREAPVRPQPDLLVPVDRNVGADTTPPALDLRRSPPPSTIHPLRSMNESSRDVRLGNAHAEPGAHMYDAHQRPQFQPRYASPQWTDPSRLDVLHGPGGSFANQARYPSPEYRHNYPNAAGIQHSLQPPLQYYDDHGAAFGHRDGALNPHASRYHDTTNAAPYRDAQEGYHVGHRAGGRDHPATFGTGVPGGSELTGQVAAYHDLHGVPPAAPGIGPYRNTRVVYSEAVEPAYNGYQNARHPSGAQYLGGAQNQYVHDPTAQFPGNPPNIPRPSPAVEHIPTGAPPYRSSSLIGQDDIHRAVSCEDANPRPAPST